MLRFSIACLALLCGSCSEPPPTAARKGNLVLTFPDSPNPPARNLIRGRGNLKQIKADDSPESLLQEALHRCGVRRFFWRELGSHRQTLVIDDNAQNRSAVKCAAKTMPIDFYMKSESRRGND